MTIRTATALALLLMGSGAQAQQADVTMKGKCEKLVIAGQDITQNCTERLVNVVARGRTSFDFTASDGQTLSFSGAGAQQEATEFTEPLQPISLVVPGRKEKDAVLRNPAPAVGSCKFSTPEPGKSMIACEAKSQGKDYAGVFLTDAKSTDAKPTDGKPREAPKQ